MNTNGKIEFIKADVSELAEVDRACKIIREKEKSVKNIGHFNTKELLSHFILLREAMVTVGSRTTYDVLRFRDEVFKQPLFGSGGVEAIKAKVGGETDGQTGHEDEKTWHQRQGDNRGDA